MKSKKLLGLGSWVLGLGLLTLSVFGQGTPIATTAFTRTMLRGADSAAVRTSLGFLSTNNTVITNYVGNGASITNLNADELRSGTVPLARLSGITATQIADSTITTNKVDATAYAAFTASATDVTQSGLAAGSYANLVAMFATNAPNGKSVASTSAPSFYGPVTVTTPFGGSGSSVIINGNTGNYINGYDGYFNFGGGAYRFLAGSSYLTVTTSEIQAGDGKYFTGQGSKLDGLLQDNYAQEVLYPTPPLAFNSWWIGGETNGGFGEVAATELIYTNELQRFKAAGMITAGWKWFCIDGGWQQTNRDANGYLAVNSNRWANGYATLSSFIASVKAEGARAGIYTSYGTNDCVGLAGTPRVYVRQDVTHWSNLGFEHLKLDACAPVQTGTEDMRFASEGLSLFGSAIKDLVGGQISLPRATNNTSMFFLMSANQNGYENIARNTIGAIPVDFARRVNAWEESQFFSFTETVAAQLPVMFPRMREQWLVSPGHFGEFSSTFPSHWLSTNGVKLFMTIHSILSSPMYSTGYGTNGAAHIDLLTNAVVLSVHQDPGVFGSSWIQSNSVINMVARKPLGFGKTTNACALALFNGAATNYTFTLSSSNCLVGAVQPFLVRDGWSKTVLGPYFGSFTYTVPADSVALLKIEPYTEVQYLRASEISISSANSRNTPNVDSGAPLYWNDAISWSGSQSSWFTLGVPTWVTNATLLIPAWSSGNTTWANTIYSRYTSISGNSYVDSYAATNLSTTIPAAATNITFHIGWPVTNAPKTFMVNGAVATNSAARILGPVWTLLLK